MADTDTTRAVEPVTTEARRKRHLARTADLQPTRRAPHMEGRRGRTLCGNYGFDQERYDARRSRLWWTKALDISTLPACKQCDKAAAKLAGEVSR